MQVDGPRTDSSCCRFLAIAMFPAFAIARLINCPSVMRGENSADNCSKAAVTPGVSSAYATVWTASSVRNVKASEAMLPTIFWIEGYIHWVSMRLPPESRYTYLLLMLTLKDRVQILSMIMRI